VLSAALQQNSYWPQHMSPHGTPQPQLPFGSRHDMPLRVSGQQILLLSQQNGPQVSPVAQTH
jgi:hypothetical protein